MIASSKESFSDPLPFDGFTASSVTSQPSWPLHISDITLCVSGKNTQKPEIMP